MGIASIICRRGAGMARIIRWAGPPASSFDRA